MQNNFHPTRKIGRSHSNLRGIIPSCKNENIHSFESSLERDFLKILEFDKIVHEYVEQPIEITYMDNGVQRHYTPDVLVFYRNDLTVCRKQYPKLIEVKYSKDLEENKNIWALKFDAASQYCIQKKWEFQILTEKEIRTDYLENVKFLLPYKNKDIVESNDTILLLHWIKELDISTPSELIAACARDKNKQAELLYSLWILLSKELIGCDLTKPLTMKSEIWTK